MSFSDEKSAARIASMNEGLQAGAKNPSQQFTGGATMYSAAEKDVEVQHSKKKNGRFVNPWPEFRMPGAGGLMKFLWESGYAAIPCDEALDKTLPVLTPDHQLLANPPDQGIHVTWIGHASVLAQFDGISMLCDPIFSSRASMSQWAGPKRYRRPALRVETLPKIDACVISHNHYDHLDKDSVKDLNRRFGAALRWFVPMGLKSWMHSSGCENVVELDWWEESSIPGKNGDVKFVFTPAQHWCKRGPADDNMVLWGSWSVLGPRNKFFFAGDTGYCQAFKQIGGRFGPFDLAAIPIGAYEPRWFMGPQHINPEEAVLVHMDLKSRFSLGIHWGTFNLSNEEYLAPPQDLKEALKKHGRTLEEFFVLKHGETRLITKDNYTQQD